MAQRSGRPLPDQSDLQLSSSDYGLGEETPQKAQGQNRSVRQIESQAGRKPGFARRTAGAKSQPTRSARGGFEHKHSASSVEKKVTGGGQKSGRQKRSRAKVNAKARPASRKRAA